ncbi:hypothetical protein E2562_009176 [Oryza meyeriana var. granulata]|uniref:Uncharacterized protein n=1 Tax=Oryza meyeriana var. granulata TaxID=110450 RepID=A0A6G1CF50_9ORYZ|nr:hypothetical protein E2562_009176 [Oryza meyeriana var. granulata]
MVLAVNWSNKSKQAIEKRISVYSQIPEENGELIQFNIKRGGQRVATMLMYLTDGVEGGAIDSEDYGNISYNLISVLSDG